MAAGVVSLAVSVLFLLVVMVVVVVVVAAAAAVFPVLLAFVSKKFFITCLSRSRIFRGRFLELHSPKVIIAP